MKELVGFWLRRKADGTDTDFILGLVELLKLYDPNFIRTAPHNLSINFCYPKISFTASITSFSSDFVIPANSGSETDLSYI